MNEDDRKAQECADAFKPLAEAALKMAKPMNDIGGFDSSMMHKIESMNWCGYRAGKIVAVFTSSEDAEAWLAAVDKSGA